MTTLRCSICANPLAKRTTNDQLREGMSAAAISRMFEGIGAAITPDTINRHKRHWDDDEPIAPKGTRKTDLALLVRDKAIQQFEDGELDLRNKDSVPGITAGLKAQNILENREKTAAKNAFAELGRGLLTMFLGEVPLPRQLEDGNTVEGEAVDVTPE